MSKCHNMVGRNEGLYLPWLGVDFGSWCYKTFVFWLQGKSAWLWHRPDRPCRWLDAHNRPIWRPNGRPVDHTCWLISTGLARCHYPRAKCDWVAPIKLFWVAIKRRIFSAKIQLESIWKLHWPHQTGCLKLQLDFRQRRNRRPPWPPSLLKWPSRPSWRLRLLMIPVFAVWGRMHWFYLWKKADFFARCLQPFHPFEVGPAMKKAKNLRQGRAKEEHTTKQF